MCDTRSDPSICLRCLDSPIPLHQYKGSMLAGRPTAGRRPAGLCRLAGLMSVHPYKGKEVDVASDTSAAMNAAQPLVEPSLVSFYSLTCYFSKKNVSHLFYSCTKKNQG